MELNITRAGITVPVPVDPGGAAGPTRGQVRGARWRRSSPGLYVPVDVDAEDTCQRIVEAVAGVVHSLDPPQVAAATGWAALHWQGARWFTGRTSKGEPLPVPVAIGDSRHLARRPGVQPCRDWLFVDDIVQVHGLPITRAERSVCIAGLRARGLVETVQTIEMAAADDLIDVAGQESYALRLKGRPRTRRLFEALALAQENAWSPPEVTLRLRWQARYPRRSLLCNPPLFDHGGGHLITPDVFDPQAGIVGQYDGVVHDESRVRRRDLASEELCRELGLEVVSMVSTDLRDMIGFERRLDSAYRRAAQREPSRAWTLEQPEWWVDTSTVAARRGLTDEERRIWLRHRDLS